MNKSFKIILLVLSVLRSEVILSQAANDWIDYNQTYFKIKIAEDGIYRISRQELISAGVPTSSIDPRSLSLYRNGTEIAIHVQGQAVHPTGLKQASMIHEATLHTRELVYPHG